MVTLEERGIEKGMVRRLLKHPQQIIKAKEGKEIAQGIFKRAGEDFLLRVVYTREGRDLKVITAYWTSKIVKYWEGER